MPPRILVLFCSLLVFRHVHGQSNDHFNSSMPLSGLGLSVVTNNQNASKDAGEPSIAGLSGGRSLWWNWTAPITGTVNFSTFGSAGTFAGNPVPNTALGIFSGSNISQLNEISSSNGLGTSANAGASFNLAVNAGQTYQIGFDDASSLWGSGNVVLSINQPPTFYSTASAGATAGNSFSFTLLASNNPLSFSCGALPAGLVLDPLSGILSGTPSQPGVYAIPVTATNVAGSSSAVLTITVQSATPATAAPVLTAQANFSSYVGASFLYVIPCSPSAAYYTATNLPPGLAINPTNGIIEGSATTQGTYVVPISASNSAGSSSANLTIVISLPPPIIIGSGYVTGAVGTSFSYHINTLQDSSGEPAVSLYAASGLPPGLSVNTVSGIISGTPQTSGTYAVTISASNPGGTGSGVLNIAIGAGGGAAPLLFTSGAVYSATQGTSFSQQLKTNGNPTNFTASGLPPGLSLNPQSGYITGTPLVTGAYTVPVSATDGVNTVSATLTINVSTYSAAVTAPTLVSSLSAVGYVGSAFSYYPQAQSNSTSGSTTTVAYGPLPPGLSYYSSSNYAIGGTPTTTGVYQVPVYLTSQSIFGGATIATGTAVLTIRIEASAPVINAAPVITSYLYQTGTVGTSEVYWVTGTSQPSSFAASGLPPGLSIDSSGTITGTPTTAGTYNVVESATNSFGTGAATIVFVIANGAPPTLSGAAMASGVVGSSFSYTIQASSNSSAFSASNLPPGLTLSSTSGGISGIPTQAGVYQVPYTVTNPYGSSSSSVVIVINSLAPPIFTAVALCETLTVGTTMSTTASTSNEADSFSASNLPPGLTISSTSGSIYGTPTNSGVYNSQITATNSAGASSCQITFVVGPTSTLAVPLITSAAMASATTGTTFNYNITASNSPTSITASNLPDGLSFNGSSIQGTPTTSGVYLVPITAGNATGTASATLTINVSDPSSSSGTPAPIITSALETSVVLGSAVSYTISNAYGTNFSASNLPSGLSLSGNRITGSPQSAGSFAIPISVSNTTGVTNAVVTLLALPAPFSPPVITSAMGAGGVVGGSFSYTIAASNSPTSFSTAGLPSGLSLNSATGVISGTLKSTGMFSIPVQATNAAGTGQAMVTLTVANSLPNPPYITSSAEISGVLGTALSYTLTTSGSLILGTTSTLPPGLSLSGSTLQGTPTAAGVYQINIGTVSNVGTLTVVIQSSQVGPPVFGTKAQIFGNVGQAMTAAQTMTGAPATFSASNLPPGLYCDSTTGELSGMPQSAGVFPISLTATNSYGSSTVSLNLTVQNAPPPLPLITSALQATASTSSTGVLYKTVASGSPTSFSATGLPTGSYIDPVNGYISGTPQAAGAYNVAITASNNTGSSTAQMNLIVSANLAPPLLTTSYGVQTVQAGNTLQFSFANSKNVSTTYAATGLPDGVSVDTYAGMVQGNPTTPGTYSIGLTATNASGSCSGVFTLTVTSSAPGIILAKSVYNLVANTAQTATYGIDITSAAPNTTFSALGLPPGMAIDSTSGFLYGIPATAGVYTATVSATNAGGTSSTSVTFNVSNPPVAYLSSTAGATGTVGGSFSYYLNFAATPTSIAVANLPPGLALSADNSSISGTPTTSGLYPVTVTSTNVTGSCSNTVNLLMLAAPLDAPVITSAATATATTTISPSSLPAGSSYFNYQIKASQAVSSYSAGTLPPGLVFNASTGVISGVLQTSGTYQVPIAATNANGSGTAVLTIVGVNSFPLQSFKANVLAYVGVPSQASFALTPFTAASTSASYGVVSYSGSGLPPGLSLNTTSGFITGTPTQAGSFPVTLSATNAAGVATEVVTYVVIPAPASGPPLVLSGQSAAGVGAVGAPFQYDSWTSASATFSAANLPPGLSLTQMSGSTLGSAVSFARISGVPTTAGFYTVPITATTDQGSQTLQTTLNIWAAPPAPTISSKAMAMGSVGAAFTYKMATTYSSAFISSAVGYAASNLPPGLSFDSTQGVISGTPTSSGSYNVPLTATVNGASGTASVQIVIASAGTSAPVISAQAGALAFVGLPFNFQVTSDSAIALSFGTLPPGLNALTAGTPVQGQLSGVPTTAGTYPVTITATNSNGASTATVTVTVITPTASLPLITLQPTSQSVTAGNPASFTVAAAGVPDPSYQWYQGGTAISGATSATLNLPTTSVANLGSYTVVVSNASGSVTSQPAGLTVSDSFNNWQSSHFTPDEISAGHAAPTYLNADGVANLLDYALDRDPQTGGGGALPTGSVDSGTQCLQLQFSRDPTKTDVSYIVEVSSDLIHWTAIASSVDGAPTTNMGGAGAVAESGGPMVNVIVTDAQVVTAANARFMRLRVTQP